MKEQYFRHKRAANCGSPVKVGANGMIDSEPEDERISRMNKLQAASPATNTKGTDEEEQVKAGKARPAKAVKKQSSAA